MKSERDKKIEKITIPYTLELKKMKLAEECGELIQAIIKDNLGEPTNFAEEFADVKLMLMQIEFMYGKRFKKFVDSMMDEKIERQLKRIKEESSKEEICKYAMPVIFKDGTKCRRCTLKDCDCTDNYKKKCQEKELKRKHSVRT